MSIQVWFPLGLIGLISLQSKGLSMSSQTPQLRNINSSVLSFLYSLLVTFNGEGNGTPLHYSCLENPMDGGAWWAAVHGVAKSRTRLSDFTFTFYFHALKREMATHSSVLAWRIPGTGEPGGLPSLGSHRVGHNWSDLASAAVTFNNETQETGITWFQKVNDWNFF